MNHPHQSKRGLNPPTGADLLILWLIFTTFSYRLDLMSAKKQLGQGRSLIIAIQARFGIPDSLTFPYNHTHMRFESIQGSLILKQMTMKSRGGGAVDDDE